MVSFSCENCGDVLTKKKLDGHRNQCRGASFTCLDCMVHFQGLDYRNHTSCMSEAQKYQGALYRPEKEKKSKSTNSKALVPQKAYVEDVPDDYSSPITIVDPPPRVPSPPPFHAPPEPVNVFDYLVGSETPNASTLDFAAAERQRMMEERMLEQRPANPAAAPTVRFADETLEGDSSLVQYGSGPVPTSAVYQTPGPKADRDRRKSKGHDQNGSEKKDKKRKRLHVEVTETNGRRTRSGDGDEIMTDAPPVLHSGLTGGLNKLLSRPSIFPPSPDYSGGDTGDASPGSPLKRSKHSKKDRNRGEGISNTIMSLITTGASNKGVDERRKKHKSRERHHRDRDDAGRSSQKMIEYRPLNHEGEDPQGQMIVYEARAELFMSMINKGPESTRGCSVNKALKRYHRERAAMGSNRSKSDEEKELWRSLRLRRNDRGEIVLMI